MRQLPDSVQAYKRTPIFNQDTIPAGLRKDHRTAEGVWGVITVVSGELRYEIADEAESHVLGPGNPGTVAPTVSHKVTPVGDVAFYVEFHR